MMNLFFHRFRQLRRRWMYGLISLIVALGLIVSTPTPSHASSLLELLFRGIQVIQLSTLSTSNEVALGRQINDQLVRREIRLYRNADIANYVDDIGQRLVPHSDRPNLPYVFQVVDDQSVNAFATMGGYVYVTTGLIRTADNEAQLASVISHEIGHIVGRHAVQQMREQAIAAGALTAAGLNRNDAVAIGVDLAIRRPNSRQDELEADELGLANLTRAGYAAGAMPAFMEKLLNQRSVPTFLSTHPATSTRIERLNALIDPATANAGDGLDNAAYRSRIRDLL
ncbi:M48 family metallopeptidase [Thermocoleostomius sinensis]|jgi:predicted Zn-dependent protease|uniref:M48 family metallopeptidase n=1 Tax=Thermocoleostomius sinensis A174 TaxID=2016057 RepID=A0A9E8ZCR7_9CYAN|nr:M48 family metallopeptidase [Thermocoleostomius sinensis]WAL59018.1 M48 family metallopeptidase [Thermocoleostomius sinensis A174]